jgi:hypothetical protein
MTASERLGKAGCQQGNHGKTQLSSDKNDVLKEF